MRTEKEMKTLLEKEGYAASEITETLGKLKELGFLDDRMYAEEYFRASLRKNWSKYRTVRELEKKGICRELAMSAIREIIESEEEIPGDEETAWRVGRTMLKEQLAQGKSADEKFLMKVGRRLAALGYSPGQCLFVMSRLRELSGNEGDIPDR